MHSICANFVRDAYFIILIFPRRPVAECGAIHSREEE